MQLAYRQCLPTAMTYSVVCVIGLSSVFIDSDAGFCKMQHPVADGQHGRPMCYDDDAKTVFLKYVYVRRLLIIFSKAASERSLSQRMMAHRANWIITSSRIDAIPIQKPSLSCLVAASTMFHISRAYKTHDPSFAACTSVSAMMYSFLRPGTEKSHLTVSTYSFLRGEAFSLGMFFACRYFFFTMPLVSIFDKSGFTSFISGYFPSVRLDAFRPSNRTDGYLSLQVYLKQICQRIIIVCFIVMDCTEKDVEIQEKNVI